MQVASQTPSLQRVAIAIVSSLVTYKFRSAGSTTTPLASCRGPGSSVCPARQARLDEWAAREHLCSLWSVSTMHLFGGDHSGVHLRRLCLSRGKQIVMARLGKHDINWSVSNELLPQPIVSPSLQRRENRTVHSQHSPLR